MAHILRPLTRRLGGGCADIALLVDGVFFLLRYGAVRNRILLHLTFLLFLQETLTSAAQKVIFLCFLLLSCILDM